ncbi:hypothetical protein ACHAW5_009735 [Stephanodiscus triporus]|uniref:Uncharacterized protein n=1 Tax=Stephanodiscus triporus TaxID=2934178 RepID=A0ABD3QSG6_9STRA
MDRLDKEFSYPVDYKEILIAFFLKHDAEQTKEAEEILNKCVGKEAILFSVLAFKYDTSNALNSVFKERLKSVQPMDHISLLKLYLSVFHPACLSDATSMLEQCKGAENELFSRLLAKFRACNPLYIFDDIGKGSSLIREDGCSPIPRKQVRSPAVTPEAKPTEHIPQSPAVTP